VSTQLKPSYYKPQKGGKMKINFDKKQEITTIAFILILTIAFMLIPCLPIVNAQQKEIPTYAFVSVAPNPVGVGQTATVLMWIDKVPPLLTIEGSWVSEWSGYKLTITKPDGGIETHGPLTSDPAAFAYIQFSPDQIGTYTFEFSFSGEQLSGAHMGMPLDNYYLPSTSSKVELVVQQEPITSLPQTPLPTNYWSRPINAQNHEWYQISGNWLGTAGGLPAYNNIGNFNPYSKAPDSAHIVWTKPLTIGGLIGGEFGGSTLSNFYTGKLYEFYFKPPIIINGILYYNEAQPPRNSFYAVDLRTGETLWTHESPSEDTMSLPFSGLGYPTLSCGQIYNYKSPNQEGGIPYLWWTAGTTWYMYDAFTGDVICTFENATSSGKSVQGPNGEMLYYILNGVNNWLAMWNSSAFPQMIPATSGTSGWQWRPPVGSTLDWNDGIQWNVTVPSHIGPMPQSIFEINDGIILATTGSLIAYTDWQMEIAYDMETGGQLWVQNRTTPVGATAYGLMATLSDGVYVEYHQSARQFYGFDASTGKQIWGPTESCENAWASQVSASPSWTMSAYGNLYQMCIDGIHAVRLSDGECLWVFNSDPTGYELPGFPTYPFMQSVIAIADGKVFASTGQQYGDPLFRGAEMYAINADTGDELWSISGYYTGSVAIADGYLTCFNGYDNQIYSYGKGQTKTTVIGPEAVQPLGTEVLIKGTVTDQSPGYTCFDTPAAGTPAIADQYMSEWMEYLYMQQPYPDFVEGVEVKLEVLDPNKNFYEIGTVTSDASGMYKLMWEPPVPGEYTVIATFEGSDSYYSSYAETAIGVTEAPSPAQPIEPEPTEPTEAFALGTTELAIIAVVIIAAVAIVAFWALKKRK
jgi:hypothetical protein